MILTCAHQIKYFRSNLFYIRLDWFISNFSENVPNHAYVELAALNFEYFRNNNNSNYRNLYKIWNWQ